MTTQLHYYQLKGVRKIERFDGRALLADEMGLGKTIQALRYATRNNLRPIVVVCNAGGKWIWENEALEHEGIKAEILSTRRHRRLTNRWGVKPRLIVINYEILGAWMDDILELDPELVVLDEAHYVKNRHTKRAKACKYLCSRVDRVVALTGTPLTNKPAELWAILNMIRPDLWGSFWDFANRYCKPKKNRWGGWDFNGAAHMKELHTILREHLMIRRRKMDVLTELPAKTITIVPVDISDRNQYEQANKEFITWLRHHDPRKVMKALRAEALMKVGYLRRLTAELKFKAVVKWIDNFLADSSEKLLVFTCHKAKMLYPLEDYYGKLAVVVDGDVVGKKRQQAYDRFNTDPKKRLFLGQIGAAGVAWSCKATSTVALVEFPWTPGEVNQAIDRVHGLGRGIQGMPVNAYMLVARDTIEEKIYGLIRRKQEILDRVLDGDGEDESTSVFKDLIKLLFGGNHES